MRGRLGRRLGEVFACSGGHKATATRLLSSSPDSCYQYLQHGSGRKMLGAFSLSLPCHKVCYVRVYVKFRPAFEMAFWDRQVCP
ncbi:MAG: hypothetical protein AVDCRST_MAG93-8199 [uncultured Chloroflexia bacterium]|uniref:Uncharacterized protein n=1 Tax=uncultured Chloroflexia bacterium TaxID=1672391 RepID=A0A6J4MTW8_9CHLR|nr:MAG: hypothetical protein AVDCRST_MAG93-8199 [uncultured Chloroflexia bacterium]